MELSIWQQYRDEDFVLLGISDQPLAVILPFIEDQGVTFPILHDISGVYHDYNLPEGQSPFPRDFIVDQRGTIRYANVEYDPGAMVIEIESLLSYPCGDCNGDGRVTVADGTYLASFIYRNGSAPWGSGDVNSDERITIADATYLVSYIYRTGAEPCNP
jgi:hypothetical protein